MARKKIFFTVYLILLSVTFIEIIYYILIQIDGGSSVSGFIRSTSRYIRKIDNNQAVNQNFIFQLETGRKGVLTSSVVNNQYEGNIAEIGYKNGKIGQVNYDAYFTITRNKQKNTFFFSQSDLDALKIYKMIDNQEVQIKFDDLQTKDYIVINQSFDIVKGANNNYSFKIIQK